MTVTEVAEKPPTKFTRPYSRIRGTEPSVTQIIGALLDKPGLSWAAAKETAMYAVFHADEWQGMDPAEAVEALRKHHRGVWDGNACMGTFAHCANEAWSAGDTIDVEAMILEAIETNRQARGWKGREAEAIATAVGYVDGLEGFWNHYSPVTVRCEEVVRKPGLWIGTADWLAEINGTLWLLDIKTTSQQDAEKAIYTDSWTLQVCGAYHRAPEAVLYEANDKGKPVEVGVRDWPIAERCGVVHLRGDGHYQLLELDPAGAVEAFEVLARTYAWLKGLKPAVAVAS